MKKRNTSRNSKNLTHHKPNAFKPLAFAIALTFTGALPISSQAATFTVTNILDTGPGSLRRAVFDANNAAGDDNIVFDTSLERATINLTTGEIVIGSWWHNFNTICPKNGKITYIFVKLLGRPCII